MPFQPGQSGNPSGRPKADPALKAAAREHAEKAISVIVMGMDSEDEKVRLAAAKEILDRGYGKAATVIHGDEDAPPIQQAIRVLFGRD